MSSVFDNNKFETYRVLLEQLYVRFVGLQSNAASDNAISGQDFDRPDELQNPWSEESGSHDQSYSVQRKLIRIDSALRRIDKGTYGQCKECGNTIQQERLWNLPYAELCYSCQQQAEHGA